MRALVFDTSAILNFGQRGCLEAILGRFRRIRPLITTHEVAAELTDPEHRVYNDQLLKDHFGLHTLASVPFGLSVISHLSRVLDPGEVSVILATAELGAVAVIDERAGRKQAQELGIELTGTLGLLYDAMERGWLNDAECLEKVVLMKSKGFRVALPTANQTFEEFYHEFD